MVFPLAMGPGFLPRRKDSAFSCWAMSFSMAGILVRVSAYWDLTWLISRSETTPFNGLEEVDGLSCSRRGSL
jgi:hypothetical protein